jgi:hypothetical protein
MADITSELAVTLPWGAHTLFRQDALLQACHKTTGMLLCMIHQAYHLLLDVHTLSLPAAAGQWSHGGLLAAEWRLPDGPPQP